LNTSKFQADTYKNRSLRNFFILFLVILFLKGILLIFLIPPWQNPDEPTHLEYSLVWMDFYRDILLKNSVQPAETSNQTRILESMMETHFWSRLGFQNPSATPVLFRSAPFLTPRPSQRNNPPLYYMITGMFFTLLPANSDPITYLIAGRFFSLFIFLLSFFSIMKTTELFGSNEILWMSGIFIVMGFHPGYSLLGSSLNPDILVLGIYYLFFFFSLKSFISPQKCQFILLSLLILFLCILTKRYILFVSGLFIWPMILFIVQFFRKESILMRLYIFLFALIYSISGFIVVCWFFPNTIFQLSNIVGFFSNFLFHYRFGSPLQSNWWLDYIRILLDSFWGSAGWITYFLSRFSVTLFNTFTLFSLLLLSINFGKLRRHHQFNNLQILYLFSGTIIVLNILVIYIFGITEGLAQGRYLYPSLFPVTVLIISGYYTVISSRKLKYLWGIIMVFYVILGTFSLYELILRSYYFT